MVQQIKKILFATDLTKSSIEVFEQTVALASQVGASIVIVHVIEEMTSNLQKRMVHMVDNELYAKNRRENQETVRNTLIGKQRLVPIIQNALKELCDNTDKTCGADSPVTIDAIEVLYGKADEVINQIAETSGCDIIAMGYYKKGSLLKALTGTKVGKNVIQESKIPLFLVPVEE